MEAASVQVDDQEVKRWLGIASGYLLHSHGIDGP